VTSKWRRGKQAAPLPFLSTTHISLYYTTTCLVPLSLSLVCCFSSFFCSEKGCVIVKGESSGFGLSDWLNSRRVGFLVVSSGFFSAFRGWKDCMHSDMAVAAAIGALAGMWRALGLLNSCRTGLQCKRWCRTSGYFHEFMCSDSTLKRSSLFLPYYRC
jgi:hypothetical protein